CTEDIALLGADGYPALLNSVESLVDEHGLSREVILHLLSRYGGIFEEVLEPTHLDSSLLQPIESGLPYLKAEIRYAVTHEKALHVSDVLMRRTRIALEVRDRGAAASRVVAQVMAPILGWDYEKVQREVSEYEELIAREFESEAAVIGVS
ncbi:MAG: glycerol-3-phosphate dehydrogenase, partial [Actinobacteria bacterium]|nr:glycerol-3-phosphate dehydrogenase [Actinomycetota bacterium]